MAQYKVLQRYAASSDGKRYGPWVEGDTIDLDDDEAAWVNRDAPNTLAKPAAKKAPPKKAAS